MGLIFAIQPDLRKSKADTLVLKSTKKKFGLGGSLLFGAALLGTMYTAAYPLFDLMWKEGSLFDKILAGALCLPIAIYPLMAMGCFMYQEYISLYKNGNSYKIEAFEKLGPFKWNKREFLLSDWNDFKIENWKGALNQAALDAMAKGIQDRYATRGHWMLKLRKNNESPEVILERRAKKEEIEFLYLQIKEYFSQTTA